MTLLVVLGIVVVITIAAALFLSLKSGRNRDGASAGSVGGRQARGGSSAGRSPSLAGRARSLGRDKGDDHRGRRVAGRGGDDGLDDGYGAPRRARGAGAAGGPERSSLVASGAGRRQDRGYPGYDDAAPGSRGGGYGRDPGGFEAGPGGRGAAPANTEAGTEVFGAGRYDSPEPPRARHGHGRGGGPGGFRESGRDARPAAAGFDFDTDPNATTAGFVAGPDRAGGRGRDAGPEGGRGGRRGRGPGGPDGPAGPGDFDDATATMGAMGASPFEAAPDPAGPADEPGQDDPRGGGRRRLPGRIQKPRLRRDKSDFDEDPWLGYEEEDGAIPDDKYWQDMYSDRPLSTTARTAQPASDPDRDWGAPPPAPGPSPAEPDPAPQGRGRRARRRQDDAMGPAASLDPGPGPLPAVPPDPAPGPGRRGPGRSRSAEEDPLTSDSFSRHARDATDPRSYRGPRDPNRPPSHGRRDSSTADTQSIRRDPQGYGADPLTGPSPLSPPGPRGRGGPGNGPGGPPPGSGLPPAPRPDPYSGNGYRGPRPHRGYRNGTGPGPGYPDRNGGYPPPPPARRGGKRPPATRPNRPGGPRGARGP